MARRGHRPELATWRSGAEPAPERLGEATVLAVEAPSPFARDLRKPSPAEGLGPWADAVIGRLRSRTPGEGPDLVLAIGLPAGAIVAGERIAAALGVPFAADLGDPWPEASTPAEERRRALGAAGLIVTTTPALAERLAADAGPDAEMLIAPNGGEILRRPAGPSPGPPLLVHLGAINAGRVDPLPAFEALAGMEHEGRIRFRSHTTGFHPRIDELPGERLPMLPHEEALALTARAAGALVLGNDDPAQLPSKAFELACSETWALCVGGDGDPARELLERSGHAVPAAANRVEDVREAAAEILAREARGERPRPDPAHTWEARVARIEAACLALADQ